jgi:fibronectin-binding autotransporter adhesin
MFLRKRKQHGVKRNRSVRKADQPRKRGRAVPIEMLESRVLLSVTVQTLIGPHISAIGGVWTYNASAVEGGISATGTVTRTNVGLTTAPSGQASTEQDLSTTETASNGDTGSDFVQGYYAITSQGLVQYADVSNAGKNSSETNIYTPFKVIIPASLDAGDSVTETDTDTGTITTTVDGTTTKDVSTNLETYTITLASETPSPRNEPAGTFNAYLVTIVKTTELDDGTETSDTSQNYFSPQVGIIEQDDVGSDGNTVTLKLANYSIPGDTLQFVVQPADTPEGQKMADVSVEFLTSDHAIDTTANSPIALVLQGGTGSLDGTTTVNASNGVATFSGLSVELGGTYTLQATSTAALGTAVSNPFTITGDTLTWTGGGDGTSWSDPKNWAQDEAPAGGSSLIFPTTTFLDPDNDISGLTLKSIDIQGSGYDLTGQDVSLSGNLTSETGSNDYDIDTAFAGAPTITDSSGDLTIDSVLSGGAVTFAGNGTITLDQPNTYTGGSTFNSGVTVNLATADTPFGTGDLTVAAPASENAADAKIINALTFTSPFLQPAITLANALVFQSGANITVDGALTFNGAVTLSGVNDLTELQAASVVTIAGNIGGTGTLGTNLAGKAIINGNVAATAVLNPVAGELDLGGTLLAATTAANQVVLLGGKLQLLGTLSGTGGIDLTDGTLLSSGAGGYAGTITLERSTETLQLTPGTSDLGTGIVVIASPAINSVLTNVPSIVNASGTSATLELDNAMTIQDNSSLNFQGTVQLGGVLSRSPGIEDALFTTTNNLTLSGLVTGVGSLDLKETSATTVVAVTGRVAAGLLLDQQGTGELDLGGTLQGGNGNDVQGDGGSVKLLPALLGTGGIDMKAGALISSGAGSFGGTITLEQTALATDPVLVNLTPGTNVLGVGTLAVASPPAEGGTAAKIVNTTGNTTELDLANPVTFSTSGGLQVSGTVSFGGAITVNLTNNIDTSVNTDVVFFAGTVGGSGTLGAEGPGTYNLTGTVNSPAVVSLQTATTPGTLVLAGTLAGGADEIVANAGTVILTGIASKLGPVTGTGGINMVGGSLTTDVANNAGGEFNYTGAITLGSGVTATDGDTTDSLGFGKGTITLNGGTISNNTGVNEIISNSIVSTASSSILGNTRLKITGGFNVASGTITISGDVAVFGAISGGGTIALTNAGTRMEVPGTNNGFNGTVTANGGFISVTTQDPFGTGPLVKNDPTLRTQLNLVDNIADPVIDSPLVVNAGVFVIDGLFTFTSGITVASGATLIIEGAGTQVVSSGALTGGGSVIVEDASFTTPGGTSGFTGTIQNQSGTLITPTLTVTDAGGTFSGSPFPATATFTGPGITTPVSTLEGVAPTFTYYTGTSATGTGSSAAPSAVGTYTVVGSFAGSTDYAAVQSAPVTFSIVTPDKLVFSVQPHNSTAGDIGRFVVKIENSKGQVVTSDNSTVTLSVASGPGVLGGTVTVKAKHGVATFDHLLLTTAGAYTLTASDGTDAAATSQGFKIAPARPAKIVFVQQPQSAAAGSSIGTISVDVEDQFGNLETGFNSTVTLSLDSDSRRGWSHHLASVRAVNGVATFEGLSIDAGGTYRLLASIDRFVTGKSDSFTITPVAPKPKPKCGD